MRRFVTISAALLLTATPAVAGQEIPMSPAPGLPIPVVAGTDISLLTAVRTAYLTGDKTQLAPAALALVKKVQAAAATETFDIKKDYVLLLWPQQLPTADSSALFATVVHEGRNAPYSLTVPGLARGSRPRLVEVFVSENPGPLVASFYTSKVLPNPVLEQVPAIVKQFVGPLFTTFQTLAGSTLRVATAPIKPDEPPPAALTAVVRVVALPEPHATVSVKALVTLPLTAAQFSSTTKALGENLVARGTMADDREFQRTINDMSVALLTACKTTDYAAAPRVSASCSDALQQIVTTHAAALGKAEDPLRKMIDTLKAESVSGTFTLDNAPLTRLSFGAVTAYAPRLWGSDQPAKVDKNQIAADPVGRSLQMAVLNIVPWGYQASTTRRWNPAGFFRPFVGVVFSPTVGISAGASFMVLNNIGVNVGYARLVIAQAKGPLTLGDDLSSKGSTGTFVFSDDLRRDPLQHGYKNAVFFGVSYNVS